MTNAEKFQEIFKKFATEVWAFPEKDFLTWLNAEYEEPTTKCDSKFCPDRKVKTTNMETILHCIENDCVAYKDGKCLKYNSDQEPTTKNNLGVDCISRAEMLKYQQYLHGKMSNEENHKLWEFIKQLPPVTPQEFNVGRWIFTEGTKGKDNVEKCSCCGSHWKEAIIYRTDTQEYLRTRLLYCPNCGADMREAEE